METTIGARIKEMREAKRVSVVDFAKIAEVGPTAIYGLEKDANKPSYDVLQRLLAHFFDINPDWLLLGVGPMLRNGRALVPASTPTEQRPQPDPPASRRIELSQDEHRRELVASVENVLLRQIIAGKDELISELRGKPNDNPDAAGPTDPTAPTPDPRVAAGFRMAWMARRRGQERAAGLS